MHLGNDTRAEERRESVTFLPVFRKVFWDLDGADLLRLYFIVLVCAA